MDKFTASKVKKAAVALGVDKPIMSYKVVGDRVELHLYGGSVATWPAQVDEPVYLFSEIQDMSVAELVKLARAYKIRGRSKMNRDQLIVALEKDYSSPIPDS